MTSDSRIDRAEHLAPRRADRPQRRELARPLRDGDREGVEDDERADEERDAGEGEQEVAEDRRELAHLVRLLLRLRGRAHDLGVRPGGPARSPRRARPREMPSCAATEIASYCPSRSRSSWAAGIVKTTKLRRRGCRRSPYWATPTSSNGRFGCSVMISTVSPTSYPCSSAVPASMTTSSAAAGQRPSRTFSGLNCASAGAVSMPNPNVGAALGADGLAFGREDLRVVSRRGRSRSRARPRRPRARSRAADASTGGVGGYSPSIEMSSPLPVTTASVPAYDSVNRVVNARSIVSVRM